MPGKVTHETTSGEIRLGMLWNLCISAEIPAAQECAAANDGVGHCSRRPAKTSFLPAVL